MNAVEYLKNKKRMCDSYTSCRVCPFYVFAELGNKGCIDAKQPEKAIMILEGWTKNNPLKTYLENFKEKFRVCALTDEDIIRDLCVNALYNGKNGCCGEHKDCGICWNKKI